MNEFNFNLIVDESKCGNIAVICGRTQVLAEYYYWELCNYLKCNPIYTTEIEGYNSTEYAIKFKNGNCLFFCNNTSKRLESVYKQFEIYEVAE